MQLLLVMTSDCHQRASLKPQMGCALLFFFFWLGTCVGLVKVQQKEVHPWGIFFFLF